MAEFFRALGLRLGIPILLLVAVCAAVSVVAPLATTAVQSLRVTAPSTVADEIARLDEELETVRRDWEHTAEPERRADLDRRTRLLGTRLQHLERQRTEPTTHWSLDAYTDLLGPRGAVLGESIALALAVTLIALVVGYPVAHAAADGSPVRARLVFAALLVAFALADPLRAWGWAATVDPDGLLARSLVGLGLLDAPRALALFHGPRTALLPVMVYAHLPMAVLPMWVSLRTLDRSLVEAARDLGASPLRIQTRIVLPHALPGIVVGAIVTFVFAVGAYAVPSIADRGVDGFGAVVWRATADATDRTSAAAATVVLALVCLLAVHGILRLFGRRLGDVVRRRDRHA